MKITYRSNNSGGSWWLKDGDWHALERAGWSIEWRGERWLGALAKEASKDFASIREAVQEFEAITGQTATDEGCNCCGAPHSFTWDGGGYASGEDLLGELYDGARPSTLRQAIEELRKARS